MNTIKDEKKLKSLKTRLKKEQGKLDALISEIEDTQALARQASVRVKNLENEIKILTANKKDLIVSEHAILRYLERTYSLDIEDIKKQLSEGLPTGVNGKFPKDGKTYIIKNNTIITVI